MRRSLLSSVVLAGLLPLLGPGGCLGADPCVDQTGYLEGCGDPSADDGSELPDPSGAERPEEHVWYTASGTLGDTPVVVTVIAVAGAFPPTSAVQVHVPGRGAPHAVQLVDGGFVEGVEATADDTVRVLVDGDLAVTLELVGELPPDLGQDEAGAPGDVHVPPAVVEGAVDVGDGRLEGLAAPYLAWVPERGSAVHVAPGQAHVRLAAGPGDALCLARVAEAQARAGAPACLVLE